jgi:hypothetical protein
MFFRQKIMAWGPISLYIHISECICIHIHTHVVMFSLLNIGSKSVVTRLGWRISGSLMVLKYY